jgi:hypothetical protein
VHATLWWGAGSALLPAPEGDPLLGLAALTFPASRRDVAIEVRLEPDDADVAARLDAAAELTVVYDEGTDDEHVLRVPIHLRPAQTSRRFRVAPEGLTLEAAR